MSVVQNVQYDSVDSNILKFPPRVATNVFDRTLTLYRPNVCFPPLPLPVPTRENIPPVCFRVRWYAKLYPPDGRLVCGNITFDSV